MKKRLLTALLLLCLLLTACGGPKRGGTVPASSAPDPTAAEPAGTDALPAALCGVWVNWGQYSDGRDFVETLTLNRDGTAEVHLEYQGKDYATLTGTWSADGDTLSVDFTDPDTRDRTYTYTLTETGLILTGDGKNVEYVRE